MKILIVIYSLCILNFFNPIIKFQSEFLNLLFGLFALMIPIILFICRKKIKKSSLKFIHSFIFGSLSIISFILIVFIIINIGLIIENGYDPSHKIINKLSEKQYDVIAYRINGGAMSSYNIIVYQEKKMILGLKLVKELYTQSRRGEMKLKLKNNILYFDKKKLKLKESIY